MLARLILSETNINKCRIDEYVREQISRQLLASALKDVGVLEGEYVVTTVVQKLSNYNELQWHFLENNLLKEDNASQS